MKAKTLRWRGWLARIALILAACGDEGSGPMEPITPALRSLSIVDPPATLLVADTVRLTVVDSTGKAVTASLTWTTGDGTVASVSNSGLVSGRAEGTTRIRVSAGTLSDSISLTVTEGVRFDMLAAGFDHTCGLTSSGAVYCWGGNWSEQLGVRTTSDACPTASGHDIRCSPRPVQVAGSIQFITVAAGVSHTCGLDQEGRAHCWGDNAWEQLGATWDVAGASYLPISVSGSQVFESLDSGGDFNCGVTHAGPTYCWGSHGMGELGTGDLELFTSAVPVGVVGGHQFTQQVSGSMHSCGLTARGVAYCWGENFSGALGTGSVSPPGAWPAEPTPTLVAGGLSFAQVAAGGSFSCGLTSAGAAWCWGAGSAGRLGDGSTTNRTSPVAVAGGLVWGSLSLGLGGHACGLTTAGGMACWGHNHFGQLGVAPTGETCPSDIEKPPFRCSSRPVLRPNTPRKFKSVIAGGAHTCGLDDLGYAFCWGRNQSAQLGTGRIGIGSHIPSPVISPE